MRVDGRRLLVDDDPVGRRIRLCPNYGVTVKPCNTTLAVTVGYSDLLRIDGRRVCLDTMRGLTDGTPPSVVEYEVKRRGADARGGATHERRPATAPGASRSRSAW